MFGSRDPRELRKMARNRNSRNGGRRRPPPAFRARATQVLAQGVGAVPRRPFGSLGGRGNAFTYWDATHPHHLALPRGVGPYSVIRSTKRLTMSDEAAVIGAFKRSSQVQAGNLQEAGRWSRVCCVEPVLLTNPINGVDNTIYHSTDIGGIGPGATLVPSAITVQVMNPEALQTTTGIFYAGCLNTQYNFAGSSETWQQVFDRFVEYQSPRLLAAGKLALRGVKIDSRPLSMSQCSEFTHLDGTFDATTGVIDYTTDKFNPEGWAPIFIYGPGASARLELLITTEWRVRFDLSNPAVATHVHHPVSTDRQWDGMVKQASSMGNGVRDIVEAVASAGQTALAAKEAMASLSLI